MTVVPKSYLTNKRHVLKQLKTRGKDAIVFAYNGHGVDDYHRMLEFNDNTPIFQLSTASSQNLNLHHIHEAALHKPLLVKVIMHSTAQQAQHEVGVHIAMIESQSCYVPMLYDAVIYQLPHNIHMNIMVMQHLTGCSVSALRRERKLQYGREFVTARERAQLFEALKDLWAVGGGCIWRY